MNNYPGSTLHEIGPYIGKIRPSLARNLIEQFTMEDDLIWDPFCGSGTIPLECRLLFRNVIAADINPYACVLTRAKLHAPISEDGSFAQIALSSNSLINAKIDDLGEIPDWVKEFFHSKTLSETILLIDSFKNGNQYFNLGCLLGILHHQRPGFLSFPASHLVPYLRDRLYPRDKYPELYEYRDPIPRLKAKIKRVLRYPPPPKKTKFRIIEKSIFDKYLKDATVDAVITSPPYMDALDYSRDNRLRLWFLGVKSYKIVMEKEIRKIISFKKDMIATLKRMTKAIKPSGCCILIVGDVVRKHKKYDVPELINYIVKENIDELFLENKWIEKMPINCRAIRSGRATEKETIMVFRRK